MGRDEGAKGEQAESVWVGSGVPPRTVRPPHQSAGLGSLCALGGAWGVRESGPAWRHTQGGRVGTASPPEKSSLKPRGGPGTRSPERGVFPECPGTNHLTEHPPQTGPLTRPAEQDHGKNARHRAWTPTQPERRSNHRMTSPPPLGLTRATSHQPRLLLYQAVASLRSPPRLDSLTRRTTEGPCFPAASSPKPLFLSPPRRVTPHKPKPCHWFFPAPSC